MYKIRKEFHFSASHQLLGLPKDHPCSNVHGHNYIVTVELQTTKLDSVGFIVDYRALSPMKDFIDTTLDHKHLNDVVDFNPTAENLCRYLYDIFRKQFSQLHAIEVSETEKTSARYEK
jgi:6-pyruvoyltetrahydropterin/6-carboxytetrahydropterin synthase